MEQSGSSKKLLYFFSIFNNFLHLKDEASIHVKHKKFTP